MKKTLKYTPLALIGVVGGALFLSAGKPKLYAAEMKHDFGVVDWGGELHHKFTLQNTGWKPLKINSIHVSCGCIKLAHTDVDQLAPGQKTPLSVSWDIPKYSSKVCEVIKVSTNDPVQPVQEFVIKADVQAHIALEPAIVNFGVLDMNSLPSTETMTLKGQSASPVDDTLKVNINNSDLKPTIERAKDGSWKIGITLSRDTPLGPIDGAIEVKPSWGNTQTVSLLGEVVGDAIVEPNEVIVDKSQNLKGKVAVAVTASETAPQGAKIKSVQNVTISPGLKPYVAIETSDHQLTIDYNFLEAGHKEPLRGHLAFDAEFNDGAKVKMKVPMIVRFDQ